ncbi:MAG: glycosyltransferase WbuB [Sulfurimonas sp.]|nr:MAG: glycosyltransferase WbuB [Sulfurimonas sp.]
MKNIWIINEYAGSPYHGMEFRHYYLGKELVKLGHKVTVVSSSYSHLFKTLPNKKKENIDGIDYLWLKTFNYKNSHNKKRVLKWFLFMFKVFFLPFFLKKPDVIIVSPMAPFVILPAWILSKTYRVKLIYEVKDIWPLSLVELGGFSFKHPFIRLMSWFEKFAIIKSDVLISNLPNYGKHIENNLKLNKKFEWISNGIDLDELSQILPLEKNIFELLPINKFIVGYVGTVGTANALDVLCEAAKSLQNNKNIFFVIVGDGQEKQNLVNIYQELDNILFIHSIEKKQVQSMLKLFDICFLAWKKDDLYKYGTSANKIFDYMYSSKPILNAFSGAGDIVKISNCGLSVEAENIDALVKAVLQLYHMDIQEKNTLGQNGKDYVLKHFTYKKLAKRFEELL